ncbi:RNA polymerase, sigma 54 subunit, RpoN/SigL [Lentibacillus halodurans]|uniref:RNA polymerase, sigma 54 subunit, RpoN/SigL n=1 Tax=Lentibacillus halodurans TaxID=237679 RepID=A0A1I0YS34_9BACI|nr:RNA polymerase factor sigma-54 [Lentibacillus halodurans]SFB14943.1 RNA polymerase, sigma 54 subunit, RpoN/SigL [Lentibacillus halodurans]
MDLMLQQEQSLNIVMTTQLRHAIELLQYSTYDLFQFIQEQELENPLIELEEKSIDMAYPIKNNFVRKDAVSSQDAIDFIPDKYVNSRDDFSEQILLLDITERERELVYYFIHNLDDNGYLPMDGKEMAAFPGLSKTEAEKGIQILQHLKPVGVGARNLQECLAIQAKHYYPEQHDTLKMIEAYLPLLANKKWHDISKRLNIPLKEVKKSYELIQTLNPKPCDFQSNTRSDYLIPDIQVEQDKSKFVVTLNDSYLPTIRLNHDYTSLFKRKGNINHYMHDCYRQYQWLLNSLDKRRETILKITKAMIRRQEDFLIKGFTYLKPMTLKEIANDAEVHESTVSRATMNKVIQTPAGIFDYQDLFTSKIATDYGVPLSQINVKSLLKRFVDKEDKQKPLSDQKISDLFKTKKGITVSRRTVAKYREALKIPSSSKRKEVYF